MPGESPKVGKSELFARLAEGHAAGITVVTPNRRLARALRREFDSFQTKKGLSVWEDADILPLESFVERLYEDSLYADPSSAQPQLLSLAQEQALWESVIGKSTLLATAETAAECAKGWKLAHQWRLDAGLGQGGNDDTKVFAEWAREYAKRCAKEGWTDHARLPDRKQGLFEKKPKLLVACGFDVLPPQTEEFLKGFELVIAKNEFTKANLKKTLFPSARHELEAAARWARARIEAGAKRVGLVVPQLGQRRREVLRVFARAGVPVDVSLGEPLSSYAVVDFALSVLQFSVSEIEFEEASRLIRSPFLGGAEAEFAARARLDERLRRRLGARVSLAKLVAEVETCAVLRSHLEKVFEIKRKMEGKTQSPSAWAQTFTSILEAAGFPGERGLDSNEYQARVKFNEVLGEFSRLTFVVQKLSPEQAIQKLKAQCRDTLFQPEATEAPVQALGILESAGLEFDALWVSGLTEEAWPLAARPNPFLPVMAQKEKGIPQASAEASLAHDRRITEDWAGAATEVVFSFHDKEEDRELLPSPLIEAIPQGEVEVLPFVSFHELVFQKRKTETVEDEKGPKLSSQAASGGTRVLADQAACPFRAFVAHRLRGRELQSPAPGLNALGRGSLIHAFMAALWGELKSSEALKGDVSKAVSKAAGQAIQELELEGAFAAMEKARLEKLAREWLEVERLRAPFQVVQIEEKKQLKVGNLLLEGRIDRLDRLADGSHAVIDYKTGERVNPQDWSDPKQGRPREPQLTIYATASAERMGAVAFARVKAGKMRFAGFSRGKDVIPEVKIAKHWPSLLEDWQKGLAKLAGEFEAGDARIEPRDGAATCRTCDLQTVCRVHERFAFLDEAGGEGE